MKKFLQEFKEFALKGNVMDMAIGVIIGAAFGDIVTALTECFIQPIIALIGGAEVHGTIPLGDTGQAAGPDEDPKGPVLALYGKYGYNSDGSTGA